MGNSSSKKQKAGLSMSPSEASPDPDKSKGKASEPAFTAPTPPSSTPHTSSSANTLNTTKTPDPPRSKTAAQIQLRKYLRRSIATYNNDDFTLYQMLEHILLTMPGVVINICEGSTMKSMDELSQSLVMLFEAHGLTLDLIGHLLHREVANAVTRRDASSTLFRQDSIASKATRFWARMVGTHYLQSVLWPPLRDMISDEESHYEVDPVKLPGMAPSTSTTGSDNNRASRAMSASESNRASKAIGAPLAGPWMQDLERNLASFTNLTCEFLRAIVESAPLCPWQIRGVCHLLASATAEHYPDSGLQAVAGFVFLRFFIPAVLAPVGQGIIEGELLDRQTRGLVLVGKVLQNAANGVLFGEKETFMLPMNKVLEGNQQFVAQFLSDLSTRPPVTPDSRSVFVSQDAKLVALKVVHQCMVRYGHRIKYDDPGAAQDIHRILEALDANHKANAAPTQTPPIIRTHTLNTIHVNTNTNTNHSTHANLNESAPGPTSTHTSQPAGAVVPPLNLDVLASSEFPPIHPASQSNLPMHNATAHNNYSKNSSDNHMNNDNSNHNDSPSATQSDAWRQGAKPQSPSKQRPACPPAPPPAPQQGSPLTRQPSRSGKHSRSRTGRSVARPNSPGGLMRTRMPTHHSSPTSSPPPPPVKSNFTMTMPTPRRSRSHKST